MQHSVKEANIDFSRLPPEVIAALGLSTMGVGAGVASGIIGGKDVATTASDVVSGGLAGGLGGAGVGAGLALLGLAGSPGNILAANPLGVLAALTGAGAGLGAFLKGTKPHPVMAEAKIASEAVGAEKVAEFNSEFLLRISASIGKMQPQKKEAAMSSEQLMNVYRNAQNVGAASLLGIPMLAGAAQTGTIAQRSAETGDAGKGITTGAATAVGGLGGGVLGLVGGGRTARGLLTALEASQMQANPTSRLAKLLAKNPRLAAAAGIATMALPAVGALGGTVGGIYGGKAVGEKMTGGDAAITNRTGEKKANYEGPAFDRRFVTPELLLQGEILRRQNAMADEQEAQRREALGASLGGPIGRYLGKSLGSTVSSLAGKRRASGLRGFFGAEEDVINPEDAKFIGETIGNIGGSHLGSALARRLQKNERADAYMDQLGL